MPKRADKTFLRAKFKPLKPLKFQRRFLRMAKFQRVIIDIMEEKEFFLTKVNHIKSPVHSHESTHEAMGKVEDCDF